MNNQSGNRMGPSAQTPIPMDDADDVRQLLQRDMALHPVIPSPWFASRVMAAIEGIDHVSNHKGLGQYVLDPMEVLRRAWPKLLPIPVAFAVLTIMGLRHMEQKASEERFETNMEYIAASGYDSDV